MVKSKKVENSIKKQKSRNIENSRKNKKNNRNKIDNIIIYKIYYQDTNIKDIQKYVFNR